ncbi:MAG: CoA pyrophosphatase [Gemmatimonadota bacterium]|nr:CoA pyrophosphatase [Gemmatimonadota bacterium]
MREAAVAVLLVPAPPETYELLLIKRADRAGDPWSGQIALPGGRRDGDDADLLGTAVRETAEETGVRLTSAQLLGELDDLRPVSVHLPQLIVRPFVFGLPSRPPVIPSEEVALHVWAACDELLTNRTERTLTILGAQRRMPGYQVGAHFLWGMTERILTPFLNLLAQG